MIHNIEGDGERGDDERSTYDTGAGSFPRLPELARGVSLLGLLVGFAKDGRENSSLDGLVEDKTQGNSRGLDGREICCSQGSVCETLEPKVGAWSIGRVARDDSHMPQRHRGREGGWKSDSQCRDMMIELALLCIVGVWLFGLVY